MSKIKTGERSNRSSYRVVDIRQSIASAARDPEAGPVVSSRNRRRGLGVRTGGKISRRGRSGESRQRGQSEQYLFHIQSLSPEASNLIALTMREHPIPKTQYGD